MMTTNEMTANETLAAAYAKADADFSAAHAHSRSCGIQYQGNPIAVAEAAYHKTIGEADAALTAGGMTVGDRAAAAIVIDAASTDAAAACDMALRDGHAAAVEAALTVYLAAFAKAAE